MGLFTIPSISESYSPSLSSTCRCFFTAGPGLSWRLTAPSNGLLPLSLRLAKQCFFSCRAARSLSFLCHFSIQCCFCSVKKVIACRQKVEMLGALCRTLLIMMLANLSPYLTHLSLSHRDDFVQCTALYSFSVPNMEVKCCQVSKLQSLKVGQNGQSGLFGTFGSHFDPLLME